MNDLTFAPPPRRTRRESRILLRKQARLLDRQTASETVSVVLKTLTGVVGVIVAVALGSLAWSASNERGLVIESFSVPPEFAQRGITGQVVASRLLDRLSEMGEATNSVRAPSTYANNWNGDIKVQIPQTGVSVGELRRYLVEWLGHQTTIGGELYRTPQGLVLAARTGTAAAATQTGASEADLDRMIADAAAAVYQTTQPYRHAIWLGRRGDAEGNRRSMEALRKLTRDGDEADRMWAFAGLCLQYQTAGDFPAAIRAASASVEIAPKFTLGYANRGGSQQALGHNEAFYQDMLRAQSLARSDGDRYLRDSALVFITNFWEAETTAAVGDYASSVAARQRALHALPGDESTLVSLAQAQVAQHDLPGALESLSSLSKLPDDADAQMRASHAAMLAGQAAGFALERGRWAEAQRLLLAVDPARLVPGDRMTWRTMFEPRASLATAMLGNHPRARALIEATPVDCYDCTWTRGTIAALSGDVAAADRWFASALQQAPSLPQAETAWGQAKLARGDIDGAIALFERAHGKGPRWAEPLKFWGDALAQQGDEAGAAEKYAQALALAPQWVALRAAIGARR